MLAVLDGDARSTKVVDLLESGAESGDCLLMSVVNWAEVYSVTWRGRGQAAADSRLAAIDRLPLQLVDVDAPTAKLAATIEVRFGLAFADCFAAALAWSRRATIVTADHDFRVLKKQVELMLV